jgi:hypothetical protein
MTYSSTPEHISHWRSKPLFIFTIGLGALGIYACLGLLLVPLNGTSADSLLWNHSAFANFAFASSPFDLSVISPFEGLGGLILPLGVWLNPADLLPHIIPYGTDPRVWSFLAVMPLMALATFFLGRGLGLPSYLAVISAQLVTMISFPPMYFYSLYTNLNLNLVGLYIGCRPGIAFITVLGTSVLAVFAYLGRLSPSKNIMCMVALPLLVIYAILCNALYTAMFFIPVAVFLAGILWGSESRPVLIWRLMGAGFCLAVCVVLNLHGFYRALFGYAARAVFPNELYVEVQQWDYLTNLIFQKGLATIICLLVMFGCGVIYAFGTRQMRGFALSVIAFQFITIGISLTYVYSGKRWNAPLPCYLEYGAWPVYLVTAVLALFLGFRRLVPKLSPDRFPVLRFLRHRALRPALVYASILALPLAGTVVPIRVARARMISHQPVWANRSIPPPDTGGIVRYLQRELALPKDGRFRGSVGSIVGVPGGETMARAGVPESAPFNKGNLILNVEYFKTFDRHFSLTGFWDLRIPTLEDNNHMVTPPFHFLVSRALSRPQDFHSRNWAVITKANPKLMAALGARFLLTDKVQQDPLLDLRDQQTNADGVSVYVYEIQGANLGDLSPIRTVVSSNASHSISLMTSDNFSLKDAAVVHEAPILGLTRADSGTIYFERGGVRVRGDSHGLSLLVLPVQFSNSLRIISTDTNSNGTPIKLLRVNLVETGVLFNGAIDIKIAHIFGPFRGVAGRLRDIEDCRRLGIKETGEIPYPPNYQPLAKF